MIDYTKSADLNNCTVGELKSWFEKYPRSNKRIIRICDICNEKRNVAFNDYSDLCDKCSKKTTAAREAARLKTIEQFSTQEARNDHSKRRIQYCKDHPEFAATMAETMIQYNKDHPEVRTLHSKKLKNSNAMKMAIKNQIGGNDIIEHHYIYDDNDLSKYTTKMTRSHHTWLHNLMGRAGIKIPHINVKVNEL